jgi:thiosulfate/3-mercaptopyruvate sulfurtransferase
MFSEAGLSPDKPIIAYCTKGIRSAFMTEVLRMLGYSQAKNYDASYYTWAGDSALSIEK